MSELQEKDKLYRKYVKCIIEPYRLYFLWKTEIDLYNNQGKGNSFLYKYKKRKSGKTHFVEVKEINKKNDKEVEINKLERKSLD